MASISPTSRLIQLQIAQHKQFILKTLKPLCNYKVCLSPYLVLALLDKIRLQDQDFLKRKDIQEAKEYQYLKTATTFILEQLSPYEKDPTVRSDLKKNPSPLLTSSSLAVFNAICEGQKFTFSKELQSGVTAGVQHWDIEKESYAIKFLRKESFHEFGKTAGLILGKEKDGPIAEYLGPWVSADPGAYPLIYRLYSTDLHDMAIKTSFSGADFKKALHDLALALLYLHSYKHCTHTDVKSENIYFDKASNRYVLGDTDGAIPIGVWHKVRVTTPGIAPPEYARFLQPQPWYTRLFNWFFSEPIVTPAFDVWSFGVVILDLLTSFQIKIPKDQDTLDKAWLDTAINKLPKKHKKKTLHRKTTFDPSNLYIKLMFTCLRKDPKERPSIHSIINTLADIEAHYF